MMIDMSKKYMMIIEKDEEGWFVSEVVGLPGCHTQAKSVPELIERTKEAIASYVEEGEVVSEEFIGVQTIEV
jgi:predicted RNase H-like HicB family nuclease